MAEFQPVSEMTYSQALAELEAILRNMQSDQCDIDKLTTYTRRASELIAGCKARLTATDAELQTILKDLTE